MIPVPAFGYDVSGHQTTAQVREIAEDPATEFIICKVSQRDNHVSSAWPEHRTTAGVKFLGGYHYAEPPQYDPIKEMQHFLATMGPKSGDLLFLDIEFWDGVANRREEMSPEEEAALAKWTLTAVDYLREETGAMPLVYTNWLWVPRLRRGCSLAMWDELVLYCCWLAQYREPGKFDAISPKAGSTKGWKVLLHQFTDNPIDRNWTPDVSELRKAAIP